MVEIKETGNSTSIAIIVIVHITTIIMYVGMVQLSVQKSIEQLAIEYIASQKKKKKKIGLEPGLARAIYSYSK